MTEGLAAVRAAATSSTSTAALAAAAAAPQSTEAKTAAPDPAALAAARAEGVAEGKAEGARVGVSAERARIKAIVGAPEAKGRDALAQKLAFETDLPAEQAVAVLSAGALAQTSRLDGNVPNPKIGVEDAAAAQPAAGLAAAVQARIAKMPGQKSAH
jgi:ATP-dependent Clp protease protease subunit